MCEKPIINICQLSEEKLSALRTDSPTRAWKEKVREFDAKTSHRAPGQIPDGSEPPSLLLASTSSSQPGSLHDWA